MLRPLLRWQWRAFFALLNANSRWPKPAPGPAKSANRRTGIRSMSPWRMGSGTTLLANATISPPQRAAARFENCHVESEIDLQSLTMILLMELGAKLVSINLHSSERRVRVGS